MKAPRRTGLIGAAAGVVAVGVAVGLAAERRAVGAPRRRPDPDAREPFFSLPADRTRRVVTDDGVPLHVEEVGPADAPLTLVFLHGYTQEMAVWHYQRQELAKDNPGRLVFYDHRSHGRSGRGRAETATIDHLGRDLSAVLHAVVPHGPIVLVGHSMGSMTILALADSEPELFGSRIVGVALISSSTGKLAELTFGLPTVARPVASVGLDWLFRGVRKRPAPFERGRQIGTDLAYVIARHLVFGGRDASPALVEFVEQMAASTPVDVIAEFYTAFTNHDKLEALDVLTGVETLVLVGSKDLLTPLEHSEAIAQALPDATFVVVEGSGHMVQLERAPLVTMHLRTLVARATRSVSRTA